jgi:signal transduction histidine kinase
MSIELEPVEGDTDVERAIREDKAVRKVIDEVIQFLRESVRKSRERNLTVTKLQEAIMWAGMDLKELNDGRTIYPDSYDPTNTKVDPNADGLKM